MAPSASAASLAASTTTPATALPTGETPALLAPPAMLLESQTPAPVSKGRPLLDMGDGIAAEAIAAAFTRLAAVDATPAPEGAKPIPKLRPFFAPLEGEALVVPEPQPAVRPKEFIMPFAKGRVTSMFNQGRRHPAIDLAGPLGTPVYSTTRKQRVTFTGRRGGYGNLVVTRDPQGRQHYYGHLHRIIAGIGTLLEQGDVLGLLGSTGRSTGPHVHYEVRSPAGRHFNPATLLFPGRSVRAGYAWNDPRPRSNSALAAADSETAAPATARAGRRAAGRSATRVRVRRAARVRAGRTARHARTARRHARGVPARYVTRRAPRFSTRYAARSGQPRPR